MIFIIEPACRGLEHSPVNSAMVQVCRLAFPEQRIRFHAEKTHLAAVQNLLPSRTRDGVEWVGINVPPRYAGFGRRIFTELLLLRHVLAQARLNRGHVLLLSSLASTIVGVKLVHMLSRNKVHVQAILHGNLSEVAAWRSRNPLVRAFDLRSALSFGADRRLRYIVLEAGIAQQLAQILPRVQSAVDWISHPIPPQEGAEAPDLPSLPLNVSFLGLASPLKGFDIFVETAQRVLRRCPGQVRFHAIGRLPPNTPPREFSALTTAPHRDVLPRELYIEAIKATHYVCLPFQGAHYELSASGTLLDAIAWRKPIIALPSSAAREIFADSPDIGHLCSTPNELVEVITDLARNFTQETYRRSVTAVSDLRRRRMAEALAPHYQALTRNFLSSNDERNL